MAGCHSPYGASSMAAFHSCHSPNEASLATEDRLDAVLANLDAAQRRLESSLDALLLRLPRRPGHHYPSSSLQSPSPLPPPFKPTPSPTLTAPTTMPTSPLPPPLAIAPSSSAQPPPTTAPTSAPSSVAQPPPTTAPTSAPPPLAVSHHPKLKIVAPMVPRFHSINCLF
ncbi:classical arabinogalactan protein 9-like [Glycine soja]|uniref:classical arabinogalactan protein 9-like n=1 Tax=Glycine soja TaxID=3848 RepID=UPI00103C7A6E|nr:classical arabinogalactan protein 9-like [Glycine soja]